MTTIECEQCGERNAVGELFCTSCRAYLGWDQTSSMPAATPTAGWSAPTLVLPHAGPEAQAEPAGSSAPDPTGLRAVLGVPEVQVAPGAAPVGVEIAVHNQSDVVDAYVADAPDAPEWLELNGTQERLMPGTAGTVRLTLRIRDAALPLAQRFPLGVRVRSQVDPRLESTLNLVVTVPEVDAPVSMRVEPNVIRVKDQVAGEFHVVADNSANNHPVELELTAQDPERVIGVVFATPTVEIAAGQIASVPARLEAPLPDAGEERSRQLTVSATCRGRIAEAVVTFVQRTSVAVADPPVALRLRPSVVTATDTTTGELRLEIDNSAGRHGAHVQLSGYDPEGQVRFDFSAQVVDVAPAATAAVTVRLAAPLPEPGGEASRQFTVVARSDAGSADASGTFRQRSSAAAISALRLRIEPPIVRVRDRQRGRARVIADNRAGVLPVRIWLTGRDHEGTAKITFSAPHLDVHPGQQAVVDAEIRDQRPAGGAERTRAFTITATDGQQEVAAEGTFTQTSSNRQLPWRTIFTLFGGFAMIVGALLPWTTDGGGRTGVQWNISAVAALFNQTDPTVDTGVAKMASAGAVIILLGALAIWGRLGPKGRLTRMSALLALVLVVGFLILVHVRTKGIADPDVGAFVVIAGCLSAYIGGQLAKR